MAIEQGTKENPWMLKTPLLSSDFTMHKDIRDGKVLVCTMKTNDNPGQAMFDAWHDVPANKKPSSLF